MATRYWVSTQLRFVHHASRVWRFHFVTSSNLNSAHEFRLQYKLNVHMISKIISQLNDIIENEVHLMIRSRTSSYEEYEVHLHRNEVIHLQQKEVKSSFHSELHYWRDSLRFISSIGHSAYSFFCNMWWRYGFVSWRPFWMSRSSHSDFVFIRGFS